MCRRCGRRMKNHLSRQMRLALARKSTTTTQQQPNYSLKRPPFSTRNNNIETLLLATHTRRHRAPLRFSDRPPPKPAEWKLTHLHPKTPTGPNGKMPQNSAKIPKNRRNSIKEPCRCRREAQPRCVWRGNRGQTVLQVADWYNGPPPYTARSTSPAPP